MPINIQNIEVEIEGTVPDGDPVAGAGNPVLVAGQDGTDVQTLKTNATGQLEVDIVSGGGTGGLTDAELRATPVPVVTQEPISIDDNGGSLTVDGTVAVTGTQTDALTDTELRASPVPVSGTVAATLSEPISVDDNGGSLTVDGTVAVTDGGGSITVDGPLTDAQLRAAAVPVSLSSDIEIGAVELKNGTDDTRATVTAANALKVDGSAVTQPVSAASLPLPTGAATAANQQTDALTDTELRATPVDVAITSGTVSVTEPVSVDDNGGSLTVDGTVAVSSLPSIPAGTNNIGDVDVLTVPAPLSTTGGGTEATALRVTVANDSTGVLSVDDNGGSLTVDGSVTANAGTNLNTSALALESGGNLAAIAASASVLDDWDESDRAKVNPIAGQAGVQGNTGTVNALTQRVVLATDVALPAGTNAIGKLAANSGVDIGDVDVTSLPALVAGTANVGKIRTYPVSGRVIDSDDETTVITVKTAAGLATASGDNTVLAAVTGKKIRVMSYGLQVQSTDALVACIWQDSSSTTQRGMRWMLTGTADGTSMQGVVRNPGDGSHFYFETAAGAGLDLNLSATADVAWEITYVEVD